MIDCSKKVSNFALLKLKSKLNFITNWHTFTICFSIHKKYLLYNNVIVFYINSLFSCRYKI